MNEQENEATPFPLGTTLVDANAVEKFIGELCYESDGEFLIGRHGDSEVTNLVTELRSKYQAV